MGNIEDILLRLDQFEQSIQSIHTELHSRSPWLNKSSSATYLCVGLSTLQRWLNDGRLAYSKIDGVIRIHQRDLDSLLRFNKPYRRLLKNQKDEIR